LIPSQEGKLKYSKKKGKFTFFIENIRKATPLSPLSRGETSIPQEEGKISLFL
jgi:hypothetical protein